MKNLNLFLVVAFALVAMVSSQRPWRIYRTPNPPAWRPIYVPPTTARDKWCRLNLGPAWGGRC